MLIQRIVSCSFPSKHTDLSGCRSPSCPACCCSSRGHSSSGAALRCRSVSGLGRADRPGVRRAGCRRAAPPRTQSTSSPRSPAGWTRTRTQPRVRTQTGTCRWRCSPVYQAVRRTLRSPSSLVSLLSPVRSQNKPRPAAAETEQSCLRPAGGRGGTFSPAPIQDVTRASFRTSGNFQQLTDVCRVLFLTEPEQIELYLASYILSIIIPSR